MNKNLRPAAAYEPVQKHKVTPSILGWLNNLTLNNGEWQSLHLRNLHIDLMRQGQSLVKLMAGCLTAPSHYLDQCHILPTQAFRDVLSTSSRPGTIGAVHTRVVNGHGIGLVCARRARQTLRLITGMSGIIGRVHNLTQGTVSWKKMVIISISEECEERLSMH